MLPDAQSACSILPPVPVIQGFELGGYLLTSEATGGDFYDLLESGPDRVEITLGDASGKGVPGAQLVDLARQVLKAETAQRGSMRDVVERANRSLWERSRPSQFVTIFHAALSGRDNRISYVNAGHPRALLLRSSQVQHLAASGPPLGLLAEASYRVEVLTVDPGDLLLLYTDGVTDAECARQTTFGEAGIRDVVSRHADRPVAELARAICEAARDFELDSPDEGDDKAVVVARRTL